MSFLETPFVPQGSVSLAAVDYRISPVIEENLKKVGIECIKTVKCPELYEAVNGHPDMLMLHTGGNRIVLAPNIYEDLAPILAKKGFAVTKGATWLARNYPLNIAYNVLIVGDIVFHNLKYTDVEVLKAFEKENMVTVNVNQGYTKCSVCILDRKTIITSDRKLSEIAEKYGIESLLINPGGIELKNMNYGFIGGASGLISKKQIAFTGNFESLHDCKRLIDFINDKGFETVILSKEKPADYGSILPLKCRPD